MINGSFGPIQPENNPHTDEKDERKRKRRMSQAHKSSDLNVDQIMKQMTHESDTKETSRKTDGKAESTLKSKPTPNRT